MARPRQRSWPAWPSCWNGPTPSSESRLATGKLPPDLLRGIVLRRLGASRPETLVRATMGVDAAAVAFESDSVCVLTTDPITTATAGAGRLAVHVVCNDLAAMGAEPIGVLATLLFPAGVSPEDITALMTEIDTTCRALNVEVLGGHTEIAPGLVSQLVVMAGVGKAPRDRLLTAAGARPGDALVLTKAAALEGTHILAADLAEELIVRGVGRDVLVSARTYADELSIVPEARLAVELGATAMHDPTEAGVVGALWEMAEASHCGFRVDVASIPIRQPTRAICAALQIDTLRLIASGALLIACRDGSAMASGLQAHQIPATPIGMVTEGPRLLIHPGGTEEEVTRLDRDELYRVLEEFASRPGEKSL